VCSECRCSHVAGYGTSGDFYGLGDNDIGHYGVGFCHSHEGGRRKARALEFAENHLKDLQARGYNDNAAEVVRLAAKEDAISAVDNMEARRGLDLIQDTLKAFQERVNAGDLTELHQGKLVEMSDKTKFELAAKLAQSIGKVTLDQLKLRQDQYIHVEELMTVIPALISSGEKYIPTQEERDKWVKEFAGIFRRVRTGVRNA